MCTNMSGSVHLYHLEEAKEDEEERRLLKGVREGWQTLDGKDFVSHWREVILYSKTVESIKESKVCKW